MLLIEDSEDDALLILGRLRRAGFTCDHDRVETANAMSHALRAHPPDIVICDNSLPQFNAAAALTLLRNTELDIPFIVVSGQIGEESAAALMRAGAHDFVLKDSLARLAPAVDRELREAQQRRERREAQDALHTAEERFRLVAEYLSDVVIKYHLTTPPTFEYLSPAITDLTGYSPEALCADPALIFAAVHPEDSSLVRQSWMSPSPGPCVYRWQRPDGTIRWIEQRLAPSAPKDGSPITVEGILRDITSQVETIHEREELARQLHQAERLDSLGQLAGGIAHDFNNLLNVISGYTDFILDSLDPTQPCRQDAENIATTVDRAAALTRQLLIFSRLQPTDQQQVDVNAIVHSVEQLLRRTIGKDIEFTIDTDPDLRTVTIDPSRLEQLVMNLVVNARAAMPDGGQLTITTTAVNHASEPMVRLIVADTGCGMTPETQRRAFEPFYTTKGPSKGTGLGLATVYGVVQESGGTIDLWSELGTGTRFTIDLPVTDQPATAPSHDDPTNPGSGDGQHILVIEDDDAVRAVTQRILANGGYHVTAVPTRDDALTLIADDHMFDLYLTDIIMPGITAADFVDVVQTRHPNTPILFMSGYTGEAHTNRKLPDNIPIVTKPFDKLTLLRHIRAALDHATSEQTPHHTPIARHAPHPGRPHPVNEVR